MNVVSKMLTVRHMFYEQQNDKESTLRYYAEILSAAERDPATHPGDITLCLSSIGMLFMELEHWSKALLVWNRLLGRHLSHVMRARILQNKAAALAMLKEYDAALTANSVAMTIIETLNEDALFRALKQNEQAFKDMKAAAKDRAVSAVTFGKIPVSTLELEREVRNERKL